MSSDKRDYRIDLLRIVACLMVICIHVTGFAFTNTVRSYNFQISNIIETFCRCAVPIFVMISGAFLLSKNISLKEIFLKYTLRIFL